MVFRTDSIPATFFQCLYLVDCVLQPSLSKRGHGTLICKEGPFVQLPLSLTARGGYSLKYLECNASHLAKIHRDYGHKF